MAYVQRPHLPAEPDVATPAGGRLVAVVGTPTDGQVPAYVAANSRYEPTTVSGSGISASMVDAKGDLIAATADDAVTRLPVGADGEVLTADSSQPTGLAWAAASGGGIAATIVDAKGDLIAATAADTVARLAVGTNSQILVADSSTATGLKWVDPTSLTAPYISAPDAITDALNDAFWRDSSLDTTGARFSGAGSWAWVNQGGATASIVRKRLELVAPASATPNKRILVQPLPSGAYRYRCDVAIGGQMTNSVEAGLVLRESATGKLMTLQVGHSGGALVWCAEWTNATTFSSTRNTQAMTSQFLLPTRLEFEFDGTNYIARYSMADVGYYTLTTRAKTAFFTTAADQIGVFTYDDNSQITTGYFREFYRAG